MSETKTPQPEPSFLDHPSGGRLAFHRRRAAAGRDVAVPGVVFLGGFMSDVTGQKALALDALCTARGLAFLRFDYRGHGRSTGRHGGDAPAPDLGIGDFTADALLMLDAQTEGPQILVGSSMGGWVMLNLALARPDRVAGLVGIAAAPDFTEDLMWAALSPAQQAQLLADGLVELPSAYSPEPYRITRHLIEDGRRHLRLRAPLPLTCPVRLLHGMADPDVPWRTSLRLAERLESTEVQLTLIKDGDHRLSRPQDLALLERAVAELAGVGGKP